MKRYQPDVIYTRVGGSPKHVLHEHVSGDYVLHADHEVALNRERDKNAHLKQLLFRVYDYVGVPDDNHSIWGPIRAVLVARKEGDK